MISGRRTPERLSAKSTVCTTSTCSSPLYPRLPLLLRRLSSGASPGPRLVPDRGTPTDRRGRGNGLRAGRAVGHEATDLAFGGELRALLLFEENALLPMTVFRAGGLAAFRPLSTVGEVRA